MLFNDLSKLLAVSFALERPYIQFDKDVVCHTFGFSSDVSIHSKEKQSNDLENGEKENQHFRYAIFTPTHKQKFSEAIILLHGLNERSWGKYLPWAYQLVLQTQKPVILFPIAYHINRSPLTWICPRLMNRLSMNRKAKVPAIVNSTFANVALSLRIDKDPDHFSYSGLQSYFDIIKLSSEMKAGIFDLFNEGCRIDFFAYSIGALLTEMLLISNPLHLFSDSRAFFFCGGSTFNKIDGSSRSIMDNQAFARLRNHLLHHTSNPVKENKIDKYYGHLLHDGWSAFLAMSGIGMYEQLRVSALNNLIYRIKAIGLKDDHVVPGSAIQETFSNPCFDVEIMDFPFKYSHEVPFPVADQSVNQMVTHSFHTVFNQASLFLSI
ncbi:MAG: DUF6051 family protein [Prevotellaceae bacterium]|jgi:hypothetical protein|nr:DUF6051 family protein [Prevotellaceae bacterium]